jgi:hypothetical protein
MTPYWFVKIFVEIVAEPVYVVADFKDLKKLK